METLTGVVARVITRKENGWGVFAVRYRDGTGRTSRATMTGVAPRIRVGQAFEANGKWIDKERGNKRGEKWTETQFKADRIAGNVPETHEDAYAFLQDVFSLDEHGLGEPQIRQLLKTQGTDLLKRAVNNPELLVQFAKDPKKHRAAILRDWNAIVGLERAAALLREAGLKKATIDRILEVYREDAFRVIQNDPYAVADVSEIGFEEADKIGRELGVTDDDERRIASAMAEAVHHSASKNGHTCTSAPPLVETAAKIAKVNPETVFEIMQAIHLKGGRNGLHVEIQGSNDVIVAEKELYNAEQEIADGIATLLKNGRRHDPNDVENVMADVLNKSALPFDDTQKEAIRKSAREPISNITGGPGTGKSAVQMAVAELCERLDGNVYLAAPTGTAAVRLNEAVDEADVQTKAVTVHKLLGGRPAEAGHGHIFNVGPDNPLKGPCTVIVDEGSMLDSPALAGLINGLPSNGRLIMVGDKHQLPSVGPGQIMRDLTESDIVPTTELTKVHRQASDSAIPHGAAAVRRGETPESMLSRDLFGGMAFFQCEDKDIEPGIEKLVTKELPEAGYDPFKDIAVLTPKRSHDNGVNQINARIAAVLNPRPAGQPVDDIRMGDRVMYRANDESLQVSNGDTGVLLEETEEHLTVRLDDGRDVTFPSDRRSYFEWAFATTIHKSQGQQYPVVIMPMANNHRNMLDRALLYTGWTRAKGVLFFVGDKDVMRTAVANTASHDRRTILGNRLETLQARLAQGYDLDESPDIVQVHGTTAPARGPIPHGPVAAAPQP